ncbi:MAG: tetratricopeptide repeat protein [Candidatus Eisenbacteria bacterium]|uniref:Regulator of microtubule dynamics protein 1 n=1 Tax=Eiseniibacteriota bacterium TaxID=2212470 RepID=A0A849SU87_UNCEI|nr:tetratricopeptide repeat protein [Candidatus Eisenbacteria bacterium]
MRSDVRFSPRMTGTHGWLRVASRALLLAVALTAAQPSASRAADAATSLATGEARYAEGRGEEARAAWLEGLADAPGNFGLLWRLARVESELSEDQSGEKKRQLAMAAVEHARAAVKAHPDSAAGHVWLAAALGRQALQEGPKTRLALSREVKSEVDRGIALDPGIGRAYHVRALWNRRLASLNLMERAVANSVLGGVPKGASIENAVADLQKAVELEPDYLNHHLELARTLITLKRTDEARQQLERVIALPPRSSLRDARYQAEARELLAKLPRPKG